MLAVCRRLCQKSNHNHKHAALVVRGGSIVSTGYNHNGRHAEVSALSKMWPSERKGTTVFSIRFSKGGNKLANAKPCIECQAFLAANGVKKVVYSTVDGTLETMRIR